MKRARGDSGMINIRWKTREGELSSTWPRAFLEKYSGFFAGFVRTEDGKEDVVINLPYSRECIKNLFKHLDGESLSISERQETMLKECVDFLLLESPYDIIDNIGFERAICFWCCKESDSSICPAKRWRMINGRQQCAICCEHVQICDCNWSELKLPHDENAERVKKFQTDIIE
tara:strand:- start:283 stop:804 length:522 start_codon:yes stop_codon:yes gene_type:complete